jgi:hypothetical protein
MVRRVIPKDALMRIPVAILTTATVLTAAPVRAQTYDPNYPVCLQTYGIGGGYIECGYTSLAQCAQSASGIAAQCASAIHILRARKCQRDYIIGGTATSTKCLAVACPPSSPDRNRFTPGGFFISRRAANNSV